VGSGKTGFGLGFLRAGLEQGERVALVTRSRPEVVLDQARALGLELEQALREERFALLEYADDVLENVSRLKNDGDISAELLTQIGPQPVERVVFDPVTPLLAGASDASATFRVRRLMQRFAALDATLLFVLDLPEGAALVPGFRDTAHAILRMEAGVEAGEPVRSIVPERLPGWAGPLGRLSTDRGAAAAVPEPAAATLAIARRRVLVVEPEPHERERLCALLSERHDVVAVADSASGLLELATQPPDLVVIEQSCGVPDGVEFCRRLRARGHNLPILLLSSRIRRQRDRIAAISAGADECLEKPIDGRLFRLKAENLLRRFDGRERIGAARGESVLVDAGYSVTSTGDVEYFLGRLREATAAARQDGVPFAVAFVRSPWRRPLPGLEPLLREYDLVCEAVEGGAAVLLAETAEPGVLAFSKRLQGIADGPVEVEYRCYDRPAADEAIAFASERLDSLAAQRVTG